MVKKLAHPKSSLERTLVAINHQFGAGSILRLAEAQFMNVTTFSSGVLELDWALGGGFPRGRIIEIYGSESSGKTTLALRAIAEVQKVGGTAAFIDMEHALDPRYAETMAVDVNQLLISQPSSGDMALEIVEQLVRSQAVDLVVVDSVAALVPEAELQGDMGDYSPVSIAWLMSKFLRRLMSCLHSQCTVIFLNQLRVNPDDFGSPERATGGYALKFYASLRLDLCRIKTLKRGNREYGIRIRARIVKNKIAPPFRVAEVDILFDKGVSAKEPLNGLLETNGHLDRNGLVCDR